MKKIRSLVCAGLLAISLLLGCSKKKTPEIDIILTNIETNLSQITFDMESKVKDATITNINIILSKKATPVLTYSGDLKLVGKTEDVLFDNLDMNEDYTIEFFVDYQVDKKTIYNNIKIRELFAKTKNLYNFISAEFRNVSVNNGYLSYDLTVDDFYNHINESRVALLDSNQNILEEMPLQTEQFELFTHISDLVLPNNKDFELVYYVDKLVFDGLEYHNIELSKKSFNSGTYQYLPTCQINNIESKTRGEVKVDFDIVDQFNFINIIKLELLNSNNQVIKSQSLTKSAKTYTFNGLEDNTDYKAVLTATYKIADQENVVIESQRTITTYNFISQAPTINLGNITIVDGQVDFVLSIIDNYSTLEDYKIQLFNDKNDLIETYDGPVEIGQIQNLKFDTIVRPNSQYKVIVIGDYSDGFTSYEDQELASKVATSSDFTYLPTVSVLVKQNLQKHIIFTVKYSDKFNLVNNSKLKISLGNATESNILKSEDAEVIRTRTIGQTTLNENIDAVLAPNTDYQFEVKYDFIAGGAYQVKLTGEYNDYSGKYENVSFTNQTITINSYITIRDEADFLKIYDDILANKSAKYELLDDIDLTGESYVDTSTKDTPFLGEIKGNGKTLSANNTLFAYAKDAIIKDIDLVTASINSLIGVADGCTIENIVNNEIDITDSSGSNAGLGGFIGTINNSSGKKTTLKNITNNIEITATNSDYVGGVVGRIDNHESNLDLINITNNRNITGKDYIGGIAGKIDIVGNVVMNNVANKGEILGVNYTAGLVASLKNTGNFNGVNLSNKLTVKNTTNMVAGLIAIAETNGNFTLQQSYNIGHIITDNGSSSNSIAGGLIAKLNKALKVNVNNCFNKGDIDASQIGGIIGEYSSNGIAPTLNFLNVYNSGKLNSTINVSTIGSIIGIIETLQNSQSPSINFIGCLALGAITDVNSTEIFFGSTKHTISPAYPIAVISYSNCRYLDIANIKNRTTVPTSSSENIAISEWEIEDTSVLEKASFYKNIGWQDTIWNFDDLNYSENKLPLLK